MAHDRSRKSLQANRLKTSGRARPAALLALLTVSACSGGGSPSALSTTISNVSGATTSASSGSSLTSSGSDHNASGAVTNPTGSEIGFLYYFDKAQNQIDSYGISAGTGVATPLSSPVAIGAVPAVPGGGSLAVAPGGKYLYVVNCYCAPGIDTSASITTYGIDPSGGILTAVGSPVPAGNNAGWAAVTSTGVLFILDGGPWTLTEYALDPTTGIPTPTGTALSWPVNPPIAIENLVVTPDGRFLYVLSSPPSTLLTANTTPSTLTAYSINPSTGVLTQGPSTTINGYVGTVAVDPLGRYLYLTDGTINTVTLQTSGAVLTFALDSSSGALTQIGSGTAIASVGYVLAPDPQGRYLYVFNADPPPALSGTVQALSVASTGSLDIVGSTSLTYAPEPSSVECDPSGQFVFMTGLGGFSSFAISTQSGSAGLLIPSAPSQPVQIGVPYVIVE
jgi:6-phosphogluconolactonase (cycloisomerase 2 family)